MPEILASLDDINANLPSDDGSPVTIADDENSSLLQISVARVIRGYLTRVIDNGTLQGWATPDATPDTVREIAAKLIAAQLYFNQTAKTTPLINKDSFAQKLYDEAIAMLQQIIMGDIILEGVVTNATEGLSDLDYWPNTPTDRSFTKGMTLY